MYMEGAGWYSSWNTSAGWWWVYLEGSIRDGILGLRCVYVYTWFGEGILGLIYLLVGGVLYWWSGYIFICTLCVCIWFEDLLEDIKPGGGWVKIHMFVWNSLYILYINIIYYIQK